MRILSDIFVPPIGIDINAGLKLDAGLSRRGKPRFQFQLDLTRTGPSMTNAVDAI
jgi:hypothetical protein